MAVEQARVLPAVQAVETQLIPIQELATGQAASIRNGAIRAVVAMASRQLKISPDKLLVRPIQPKNDLDYTYASWYEVTGATSAAYETMSTGTMAADRFAGFYGVQDESSEINCTLLKFKVGNSIKAIWNLQDLYSENDGVRIGFSPSVVIVPQNITYTISRYVENVYAAASIILKGFIVERIGLILTP